jgi:hypothetical protein
MSTALKFFQLTALPATLAANAFYFVQSATYAESYLTDASGVAKSIGNSAMINSLINSKLADFNALEIVADISARNALAAGAARNFMALVVDATGDTTVTSGAALYAWRESNTTWSKLCEYESMDVSVAWSSISGRPNSTPAQIDTAVGQSHTHANKATLDALGADANGLTYNGDPVQAWATTNW